MAAIFSNDCGNGATRHFPTRKKETNISCQIISWTTDTQSTFVLPVSFKYHRANEWNQSFALTLKQFLPV